MDRRDSIFDDMDTEDLIFDVIDKFFPRGIVAYEQVAREICKALNICEKCGAKLKGHIKWNIPKKCGAD